MLFFTSSLAFTVQRSMQEFQMAAQLQPSKRDRFSIIFKSKQSNSEAKQSKISTIKKSLFKLFSTTLTNKSFRKAVKTENSPPSLPALAPKPVEIFPKSHELSPNISKVFAEFSSPIYPQIDGPSPKIKEVRSDVEGSFTDLVLTYQGREEPPREIAKSSLKNCHKLSLTSKKLCPDIALLSPGLNKLSPGMNRMSLKRENLPLQDSEPCLKTKRNVMPEVFLFPPEICLETLEVEEAYENEEFWQDILSPLPERDETSSDINQLSQEGDELSSKNDLCPSSPLFFSIPEELSCSASTTKLPNKDELSLRGGESCSKKQIVTLDMSVDSPALCKALLEDEPKPKEKVKARRYRSEPLRRKELYRPRFVSEPCGNMYTQLMAKQGAKLTKAAYELTEEQSRMLYEDMFKPLDVFSLMQERSKK